MLALVRSGDSEEAVELRDVPEPDPAPNEAVIEVGAVSLNRGELTLLAMRPDGWRPGQDVGGVVLHPAADGTGPHRAAAVVAWVDEAGWGQRVAAPTSRVVALPETVAVEAAATLPVAGLTALRTLRIGGQLIGQRVLVTGAAGGVGRFAVQIAAMLGAEVVAVARNAERGSGLRDLGAGEVVPDVESAAGTFDLILESAGGPSLSAAVDRLSPEGIRVVRSSQVYESEPVGPPQPEYLNAVIEVATELDPRTLLRAVQDVETSLGRVRGERWGPRTIDIDILTFGDREIDESDLVVPHPRMHERSFVLLPLGELESDPKLPGGRSMSRLRLGPDSMLGVEPFAPPLRVP